MTVGLHAGRVNWIFLNFQKGSRHHERKIGNSLWVFDMARKSLNSNRFSDVFDFSSSSSYMCCLPLDTSGRCGLSYRYSTYRAKGQHWCESYGLNANLIQTILFVVYFIGFLSVTRTHKHHDVHINNITAELNENVECELIERDIETMHTTRVEDGYNVSLLKVSYIFIYYLASRKSVSVAIFCTCSALVRLVAHPWLIRYLVSFSFVRFAFNASGQYHSDTISVLSISSFTDQFIGTMNITNTHTYIGWTTQLHCFKLFFVVVVRRLLTPVRLTHTVHAWLKVIPFDVHENTNVYSKFAHRHITRAAQIASK